ncbi:MAG: hypothetical protein JWM11_7537, partial [Planctomycetaceae bacterium]|nr:hypothetical protein [Planctomycetaceae bacterium]
ESHEEPTEESLEDEYQRILMGGDSSSVTSSRRKEVDSDAFLSSGSSDNHPQTKSTRFESVTATVTDVAPPKSRPRTTAEMADALIHNTAEATVKKTGKAFGEGKGDKGDVRSKAAAAARMYYLKQIAFVSLGAAVLCLGLYYMMSSMMGSLKYPPLGRVAGTITFDGKPLEGATVSFQPIQEGNKAVHAGGSAGVTDKSGHFDMLYVEGVHGAALGKHFVQIHAQNEVGLEVIPNKYNDFMSPAALTFEVKAGSNPPADFALMTTK